MGVKTTAHFEGKVLVDRPYLRREWCERVRLDPEETATQPDGRIRYFSYVEGLAEALSEYSGKPAQQCSDCLRVVTLSNGETVHNAMPDGGYSRRRTSRRS